MRFLRSAKPPEAYNPSWLRQFIEDIRVILNFANVEEVTVVNTDTALLPSQAGLIECSGAVMITLPKASDCYGLKFYIAAGSSNITVSADSGDTLNNVISFTVNANTGTTLISNGQTSWRSV